MTEPGYDVAGWDAERLARARRFLDDAVRSGAAPSVALMVGRDGAIGRTYLAGYQRPGGPEPIRTDAQFLVASITKPVVAVAVMRLIEDGRLTLDDRVADFVPEFQGEGKPQVRLRHLLTHTSGLPDQLPENFERRAAHAALSEFVAGTCRHPLLFPPGTRVRYQSMGFALLGEVVRLVSGSPLPGFLRDRVFEPLGMHDTALGVPPEHAGRVAGVVQDPAMEGTDWGWNSPYWLGLGAPWGGLLTTPHDLGRLALAMLGGHDATGGRFLSPAAIRVQTTNQLAGMDDVPEADRRGRPWGLGWRLAWPGRSANFGDLIGPRSFGHWGATGSLLWIDPDADAFAVILTNVPGGDDGSLLARAANLVAAALE